MNEKMFWQLYKINPIAKAMGFALESPDKKIRQRVYEHFKDDNYKKWQSQFIFTKMVKFIKKRIKINY